MRAFKLGDDVLFNNKKHVILEVRKGGKTNKVNLHSGIMKTGIKSKPCIYKIDNNLYVRGNKLKRI